MQKDQKNVIIAGSTKCGTTSLFRYLSAHPQICASVIKETRFFWNGDYELPKQKINGQEVKNYDDFFSNCTAKQWRLEATPDYLYSSSAAKKIKSSFPECRIIFILRDPLQRIISWFKYSRQTGRLPENTLPDDYIKLMKEADYAKNPQHLRALEQGRYAEYLQHYLNLFKKENILITFYNNLQNKPGAFMTDVCSFLEIDKSFYDNFDFRIYNPSINVKDRGQYKKYIRLKKLLRGYNNKLPQSLRKFSRKLLKPLDVFYLKSKSTKWEEINLSSSLRQFVTDYYQKDHELLEEILKKKMKW